MKESKISMVSMRKLELLSLRSFSRTRKSCVEWVSSDSTGLYVNLMSPVNLEKWLTDHGNQTVHVNMPLQVFHDMNTEDPFILMNV